MAKKRDDKKKDKKKKDSEPAESVHEETVLTTTDLEPEPEEVQFTDTSYTSASFESLPPPPEEIKVKKKKKRKLGELGSSAIFTKVSSELFRWSEESVKPAYADLLPQPKIEEPVQKKKGKKGKKKVEEEIPDFDKVNHESGRRDF